MTLYLFPNVLGAVKDYRPFFPSGVEEAVAQIDGLIAESEREGRRFLKRFITKKKPHEMPIASLRKGEDVDFLLEPVVKGENWGAVADAGLMCLADPGSELIRRASQLQLPIHIFVGPSSIFLALMQSGLSGQRFTFHGYISRKGAESLLQWEKNSWREGSTQLFIETPYRNEQTFQLCLKLLKDKTLLCVASQLTLPDQWIRTAPISEWKKMTGVSKQIARKPTIFLFQSSSKIP
ncbi:MAG: SAM-dependent methyltransferase [Chlamydiales bacterium]